MAVRTGLLRAKMVQDAHRSDFVMAATRQLLVEPASYRFERWLSLRTVATP